CHAKGREGRASRPLLRKERVVHHIGAGVTTLDVVNTQLFEQCRDADLVLERELDSGGLCTITQRGVEEIQAFLGHHFVLGCGVHAAVSWSGCWWLVLRISASWLSSSACSVVPRFSMVSRWSSEGCFPSMPICQRRLIRCG